QSVGTALSVQTGEKIPVQVMIPLEPVEDIRMSGHACPPEPPSGNRPAGTRFRGYRREVAAGRSIDGEDAALDVPHAAVCLDRIVLAVEVVERTDGPLVDQPRVRIAEVPAPAVVADDDLRPPGL